MKCTITFAFVTAALISTGAARMHAQTNVQSFEIRVPFSFQVGSEALPAGTYEVGSPSQNILLIRSEDGRLNAYSLARPGYGSEPGVCQLIFSHYDEQNFLHRVDCSALFVHAEMLPSPQENRARMREAQLPRSEIVVAALDVGAKQADPGAGTKKPKTSGGSRTKN